MKCDVAVIILIRRRPSRPNHSFSEFDRIMNSLGSQVNHLSCILFPPFCVVSDLNYLHSIFHQLNLSWVMGNLSRG